MRIYDQRTCGLSSPLGIGIDDIYFSCKTDGSADLLFKLYSANSDLLHSEKISWADLSCFRPAYGWEYGTVYSWRMEAEEAGSEVQQFETAVRLSAPVITSIEDIPCPVFMRVFRLPELGRTAVRSARLYISGLGLYRAFLNGEKIGDDYLAPFFNDYDSYVRYQTYDVKKLLCEENKLEVFTGDGWYKGRFGIDGHGGDTWGDSYYISALLRITDVHGAVTDIVTDESWKAAQSVVRATSIYDGETRDDTFSRDAPVDCVISEKAFRFIPDFTHPVRVKHELKPALYVSPLGENILDFGQNMVGFCRFRNFLAEGEELCLQYGEVLQDECFYRDNLRSAKAEYRYTSDGTEKEIEPWFTFFGFRYVKVSGPKHINSDDFTGVVLYSDLRQTAEFTSGSPMLNRLVQNTLWSQRGNFLDVPTDCPQRDERLGWTADTQVFVNTGCYNMDCLSFYKKYMRDLRYEQETYYNGDLPMYAPSLKGAAGNGGAVWADAGVIIPWNVYMAYGDRKLLAENYQMMKDYIHTLVQRDNEDGGRHIIRSGFTFGDWLAADGICDQSMIGGTEDVFIKTAYYYGAAEILSNAAEALGLEDDHKKYLELSGKIKSAAIEEYFTPTGRFALDTQTSYILALKFGLYPDKERILAAFRERLRRDLFKMKSGFTGTPLMLPVLFENGMAEEAYRILFNEEPPGWMYAVKMGATTIWERWNSILPDGRISGIHMNSLNHYAYGSVCEAVYANIAGLKPAVPGWGGAVIAPEPNHRLKSASVRFDSPKGMYSVLWEINDSGEILLKAEVPAGCYAEIRLPSHPEKTIIRKDGGHHEFIYRPEADYLHPFSENSLMLDILNNPEAREIFREELPAAFAIVTGEIKDFMPNPLISLSFIEIFKASIDDVVRTGKRLTAIRV